MADDDFESVPEFDRYVGYIADALASEDDWYEIARKFLRSLGENPDELEKEWAEEQAEIRAEVNEARRLKEDSTHEQPKEAPTPTDLPD